MKAMTEEQERGFIRGLRAINHSQQQKRDFLDRAHYVFFRALDTIEVDSTSGAGKGELMAAHYLRLWTAREATDPALPWDQSKRFTAALCEGLNSGAFSISTDKDAFAFSALFSKSFFVMPAVVEHYVATGEILDLMKEVIEHEFACDQSRAREHMMFKVARLYAYDMRRRTEEKPDEADVNTGDDEKLQQVPLAIRLEFSGFYEPVNDAEVRWYEYGDAHSQSVFNYDAYRKVENGRF